MDSFLNAEKLIYPVTPQRVAVDDHGTAIGGRLFAPYAHSSAFGAARRESFELRGVWLPESCCTWAASAPDGIPAAFQRTSDAGTCFLFLIHPDSETLYQPLLQRFEQSVFSYQAISLSSVRSLLVDIPDESGRTERFFVKLSLNAVIGNVSRVLSYKECLSSIGNAIVLDGINSRDMAFMRDICTIVPDACFIDPTVMCANVGQVPARACGMIVREVPVFLLEQNTEYKLLPFFSLFHQNGMLETMVAKSGLTASKFLQQFLLLPFAKAFVDLLFFHHVSIEAHGQNLLWVIAAETGLPCRLMYRDMGGVNLLLTADNRALLPEFLRNADHYHEATHLEDACVSLEDHWVGSVLFNLNKRLLRSESLLQSDGDLATWARQMNDGGFLCNWQLRDSAHCDQHQQRIPQENYRRYGYVEELFKAALTTELLRREIPQSLVRQYPYIPALMQGYATSTAERIKPWFEPLVYTLYSHWLALNP